MLRGRAVDVRERRLPQLRGKQLFGGARVRLDGVCLALLAVRECAPLLHGRATVKHEHGADAVEEQLEDAPQETEQVRIGQRAALLVAHRHLEMVQPDRRVDREPLALERLESA